MSEKNSPFRCILVRKTILISLIALSLLVSCSNNDEFTINGSIENTGGIKKVMLYEMDELIDSAFLNQDGKFRFRRASAQPGFYTLVAGEKNYLLVAKNGDEIKFGADLADAGNAYKVTGSDDSEKISDFNKISNNYGKIYQQIEADYSRNVTANPEAKDSIYNALMPKFQQNMDAFSEAALKFGEQNKDNLAGFYAVGTIDQQRFEKQLIKYAEDIKGKFAGNKAVESFISRMEEVKPVAVGQPAPQFELPTPDGEPVKLSDLQGKYVLLDFWASWCAPCREENPNIVKQYDRFKEKGFTVLGVSLDKSKEPWIRAIEADGLNWTHVSELKEWNGKVSAMYQVQGIPASFLLDPQGKIVAKNLRGAELENFLKSTL